MTSCAAILRSELSATSSAFGHQPSAAMRPAARRMAAERGEVGGGGLGREAEDARRERGERGGVVGEEVLRASSGTRPAHSKRIDQTHRAERTRSGWPAAAMSAFTAAAHAATAASRSATAAAAARASSWRRTAFVRTINAGWPRTPSPPGRRRRRGAAGGAPSLEEPRRPAERAEGEAAAERLAVDTASATTSKCACAPPRPSRKPHPDSSNTSGTPQPSHAARAAAATRRSRRRRRPSSRRLGGVGVGEHAGERVDDHGGDLVAAVVEHVGRRLALFGQREDVTRVPLLAEGEPSAATPSPQPCAPPPKVMISGFPVLTRARRAAAISASDPELERHASFCDTDFSRAMLSAVSARTASAVATAADGDAPPVGRAAARRAPPPPPASAAAGGGGDTVERDGVALRAAEGGGELVGAGPADDPAGAELAEGGAAAADELVGRRLVEEAELGVGGGAAQRRRRGVVPAEEAGEERQRERCLVVGAQREEGEVDPARRAQRDDERREEQRLAPRDHGRTARTSEIAHATKRVRRHDGPRTAVRDASITTGAWASWAPPTTQR